MRKVFVVPMLPHGETVVRRGDEMIRLNCVGEEVF